MSASESSEEVVLLRQAIEAAASSFQRLASPTHFSFTDDSGARRKFAEEQRIMFSKIAAAAGQKVGPRVRWLSSHKAGGCNFCTRHATPRGENLHDVMEVTGERNGSMSVRFCRECLARIVLSAAQ